MMAMMKMMMMMMMTMMIIVAMNIIGNRFSHYKYDLFLRYRDVLQEVDSPKDLDHEESVPYLEARERVKLLNGF
jgi:hypothetical protein